jgi:hypothetical protein
MGNGDRLRLARKHLDLHSEYGFRGRKDASVAGSSKRLFRALLLFYHCDILKNRGAFICFSTHFAFMLWILFIHIPP